MIEREFVKFNTSINTGTNADKLITDSEGNIQATIELQLPQNLFDNRALTRRIEKVEMQTSKFRLSLEDTPIAQIPLDTEVTTTSTKASKCQLDVYPFCLLDDDRIKPEPGSLTDVNAFPNYKNHLVTYKIYLYKESLESDPILLGEFTGQANTKDYGFPSGSRFYNIMKEGGALSVETHLLNLCAQSNHEPYNIEGDKLYIKNIGTLEQMLQDAIENAITYASTSESIVVNVYLLNIDLIVDNMTPSPQTKNIIVLDDYGITACFWKYEKDTSNSTSTCALNHACKPSVKINEQSLSISYDSVAFDKCIPIFWNTPYVDTFDQPEQLTIDKFRNNVWTQKPPKRQYKYSVTTSSNPDSYNFALQSPLSCAAMNLIANQTMVDTFSFLPWIYVDTSKISSMKELPKSKYHVKNDLMDSYVDTLRTDYYVTVRDDIPLSLKQLFKLASPSSASSYSNSWAIEGTDKYGNSYSAVGASFLYIFRILTSNIVSSATSWREKYPWNKRISRNMYIYSSSVRTDNNARVYDKFYVQSDILTTSSPSSPMLVKTVEEYDTNNSNLSPGTTTIANVKSSSVDSELSSETKKQNLYFFYGDLVSPTINDVKCGEIQHGVDISDVRYPIIPPSSWDPYLTIPPVEYDTTDEPNYTTVYVYWSKIPDNLCYFEPESNSYYHLVSYSNQGGSDILYSYLTKETIIHRDYTYSEDITVTDNDPNNTSFYSDVIPNLDVVNNKFYILDGTTASVDIGPQEVIDSSPGNMVITKTTSFSNYQTRNETQNYWAISSNSFPFSLDYNPIPTVFYLNCKYHAEGIPGDPSIDESLSSDYRFIVAKYKVKSSTSEYYYDIDYGNVTRYGERTSVPSESGALASVHSLMGWSSATPPDDITTTEYSNNVNLQVGSSSSTISEETEQGYQPSTFTRNTRCLFWSRHITAIQGINNIGQSIQWGVRSRYGINSSTVISNLWADEPNATVFYNREYTDSDGFTVNESWWRLNTTRNYNLETVETDHTPFSSYYIINLHARYDKTITTTISQNSEISYTGNIHLTFTWDNLPIVVMSPITSIVLSLQGIQVQQEYQPINKTEVGGSSLTSSIPIVENFYSLAQSLRDLHDELVVTKEHFTDVANYAMDTSSGKERIITLSAQYITKDGTLHQIYIPKHGVFSVQLTFGLTYYTTS